MNIDDQSAEQNRKKLHLCLTQQVEKWHLFSGIFCLCSQDPVTAAVRLYSCLLRHLWTKCCQGELLVLEESILGSGSLLPQKLSSWSGEERSTWCFLHLFCAEQWGFGPLCPTGRIIVLFLEIYLKD